MTVFKTLEAFAETVGRPIGPSSWVEVTQQRIDAFAAATGDDQWIHIDPERTQRELGTVPMAHGYLTLSLIPCFVYELVVIESLKRSINYGCDRVRFVTMVPAGARLRGSVVLKKAVRDPGALRAHATVTVEMDGAQRPALVADTITLFYE